MNEKPAGAQERRLPLQGYRVLDLTVMGAGPIGTMLLGDMGADIIKIEELQHGDHARNIGKVYVGGESSIFLAHNRNKRSVRLDLKKREGRDVFMRMAASADVVLENFRPGTVNRLGISYEAVRQVNRGVIYASISAFGQTGPYAHLPANDPIIQALSGLMAMTGDAQGGPVRVGHSVPDLYAAMLLAFAVSTALLHRERTGEGQQFDFSLLGVTVFGSMPRDGETLRTGKAPERLGSGHPSFVPYRNYQGADGSLFFLSCFTEKFWLGVCDAIGRPDLKTDPRTATNVARCQNREFLDGELEAIFKTRDTDHWLRQFAKFSVPAARVQDLHHTLRHDPQVAHNKTLIELDHPTAGKIENLAFPVNFRGTPARYDRPPPRLGEHSAEILREFGFGEREIESLMKSGVVAGLK